MCYMTSLPLESPGLPSGKHYARNERYEICSLTSTVLECIFHVASYRRLHKRSADLVPGSRSLFDITTKVQRLD